MKKINAFEVNINRGMVNSDALNVIQKLQQHHFDGYIVGGGVRDLILGKIPKDFDVVTNATPEEIKRIFKRNSIVIGRRFRLVHVMFESINPDKIINNRPLMDRHVIEVSTYRSNKIRKHVLSEHGRILEDNVYGTMDEDASRRDFTVNALFYDPINEVIFDGHGGLKDLKNRLLRIIGDPAERYIEDPVRIIRALRLSIKLGLDIEENTKKPFDELKDLLKNEPRGRMYEEMLKLLRSGYAVECIAALDDLDISFGVFPLFDKIFFGNILDEIAMRVVAKTDERLSTGEDVSTIFILAGLMWNMVNNEWRILLSSGGSPRQTLTDAISHFKGFAYSLGITRHAYTLMRDVWLLQLDFENPSIKRIDAILSHQRLRQAWHLFSTRHEFAQVDTGLHQWWDKFMIATDDERSALLLELASVVGKITSPKRKPRRRARKKLSK